jgi:hypothetical protein
MVANSIDKSDFAKSKLSKNAIETGINLPE